MFYIEDNNKIILFSENKSEIIRTLRFMPQYTTNDIKETNRPIVNFEFTDTEEYANKHLQKLQEENIKRIKAQIEELDKKRIRAICELSIKDAETGETWLEYYNKQIAQLRQELNGEDVTESPLPNLLITLLNKQKEELQQAEIEEQEEDEELEADEETEEQEDIQEGEITAEKEQEEQESESESDLIGLDEIPF